MFFLSLSLCLFVAAVDVVVAEAAAVVVVAAVDVVVVVALHKLLKINRKNCQVKETKE